MTIRTTRQENRCIMVQTLIPCELLIAYYGYHTKIELIQATGLMWLGTITPMILYIVLNYLSEHGNSPKDRTSKD